MKRKILWFFLAVTTSAMVCGCDDSADSAAGDATAQEGERGGIGKADLTGSCVNKCGKKGSGNCYCDDSCPLWGDCCSDYTPVCKSDGCPQYVSPPEWWCDGGKIVPQPKDSAGCSRPPKCERKEGAVCGTEHDFVCDEGFECAEANGKCALDCPNYDAPPEWWCDGGKIVPQPDDANGCSRPAKCERKEGAVCGTEHDFVCDEGFECVEALGKCALIQSE